MKITIDIDPDAVRNALGVATRLCRDEYARYPVAGWEDNRAELERTLAVLGELRARILATAVYAAVRAGMREVHSRR